MIQGSVKTDNGGEEKSYSRKVGVFNGNVVAINPSKAEMMEILGISEENQDKFKDPEYLSEDQDGNNRVRVSVYLKTADGDVFNPSFLITNKERVSKSGKKQYRNTLGSFAWSEDGKTFNDYFNSGMKGNEAPAVALAGEEEFYSFLKAWLSRFNFKEAESFSIDASRLFKGNFKEIRGYIGSEFEGVDGIFAAATVRAVDDKQYQSVYSKEFLAGWNMKIFKEKGQNGNDNLKYFFKRLTDPEYGCKDVYDVALLHDYDGESSVATTTAGVHAHDPSDSDY